MKRDDLRARIRRYERRQFEVLEFRPEAPPTLTDDDLADLIGFKPERKDTSE